VFLLGKVRRNFKLTALNSKFIMLSLLFIGIVISVCEIYNIFIYGLLK
jgi:TM2 domain-containing membrane protein YozV